MHHRPIRILEFPLNLGLLGSIEGVGPGVKKLPEWLNKNGFHNLIRADYTERLPAPQYEIEFDAQTAVLNANKIRTYAKRQSAIVEKTLANNEFPVVLGGDCSILVGSAVGLKKRGDFALFYLDGHHDFVLPEQSHTKAAAGMVAAIVGGLGPEKLTNIYSLKPYFELENIWCVGNREYGEAYEKLIRQTKTNYTTLVELRNAGLENYISSFLREIDRKELDGYWLHIDLDVLNDAIMPAVDSRSPDGLSYEEFKRILSPLLSSPEIAGLQITILDPDLDPKGEYTRDFVKEFTNTFNLARS